MARPMPRLPPVMRATRPSSAVVARAVIGAGPGAAERAQQRRFSEHLRWVESVFSRELRLGMPRDLLRTAGACDRSKIGRRGAASSLARLLSLIFVRPR